MDIVTVLATVVISVCGVVLLRRQKRHGCKPVPGPRALPILGNASQIDKTKMHMTLYEWMKAYGDVFQFAILGRNYVVLNCSDLLESVVSKLTVRPQSVMGALKNGNNRPTFSNNIFHIHEMKQGIKDVVNDKTLYELSDEEVKVLINTLRESVGSDVAVNKVVKKTITSQMLIALIGCKPTNSDIEAVWDFLDASEALLASSAHAALTAYPWLRYIPGTQFKKLYNLNKSTMEVMIKELTQNRGKRDGRCHGLIAQLEKRKEELEGKDDENVRITDANIRGNIVDSLFGLFPLVLNLIGGVLCIAKHTSVQDKIHAELDNICQHKPPILANRGALPYLNATILEIHRYISILATTLPYLATEDTEVGGFFVKKDTVIFGGLFNLHHSEDIWNDPWTFRPERFIDESGKLLSSKHAMPFSTGPRMCTGYPLAESSIFTCLANILYNFDILPPSNGDLPDHDPRTFQYGVALKLPLFSCRFQPRVCKEAYS